MLIGLSRRNSHVRRPPQRRSRGRFHSGRLHLAIGAIAVRSQQAASLRSHRPLPADQPPVAFPPLDGARQGGDRPEPTMSSVRHHCAELAVQGRTTWNRSPTHRSVVAPIDSSGFRSRPVESPGRGRRRVQEVFGCAGEDARTSPVARIRTHCATASPSAPTCAGGDRPGRDAAFPGLLHGPHRPPRRPVLPALDCGRQPRCTWLNSVRAGTHVVRETDRRPLRPHGRSPIDQRPRMAGIEGAKKYSPPCISTNRSKVRSGLRSTSRDTGAAPRKGRPLTAPCPISASTPASG